MKLKIPQYEKSIELIQGTVTCLNCFNTNTFSSLINSLNAGLAGNCEDIFFSEDLKSISLSKFADIIYCPYLIDLNSKKIQTALLNKIKGIFKIELEQLSEIDEEYKILKRNFKNLISEINIDLEYDDSFEAASIIKFLGLKIFEDDISIDERILKFIRIGSELSLFKYLFCLNFKSYFDLDKLKKIEAFALQCDIHLILLDCFQNPFSSVFEKQFAIDEPLDKMVDDSSENNIVLEYVFD